MELPSFARYGLASLLLLPPVNPGGSALLQAVAEQDQRAGDGTRVDAAPRLQWGSVFENIFQQQRLLSFFRSDPQLFKSNWKHSSYISKDPYQHHIPSHWLWWGNLQDDRRQKNDSKGGLSQDAEKREKMRGWVLRKLQDTEPAARMQLRSLGAALLSGRNKSIIQFSRTIESHRF